jgi:hypothetical protein
MIQGSERFSLLKFLLNVKEGKLFSSVISIDYDCYENNSFKVYIASILMSWHSIRLGMPAFLSYSMTNCLSRVISSEIIC